MAARKKKKIVFVCTGNTCRSPMAQLLLTKRLEEEKLKGFDVRSAGIAAKKGDGINPKSAQVLQENGIDVKEFSATKLSEKLLLDAFAVVCMTERQREFLMDMRWNALKKAGKDLDEAENNVYSFAEMTRYEILDPYGKDIDCYRYVFGLLSAGMSKLTEKLLLKDNAWETKPRTPRKPKTTTAKSKASTQKTKKETPKKDVKENKDKQLSIFKE